MRVTLPDAPPDMPRRESAAVVGYRLVEAWPATTKELSRLGEQQEHRPEDAQYRPEGKSKADPEEEFDRKQS